MCELSGKLMAWLDHELESDEMAGVERHIEECAECQREVAAYREVSATFHSYCDAVMESRERRRLPQLVPVLSAAGAIAFAVVAFIVFQHRRVEPLVPAPVVKTIPAAAAEAATVVEPTSVASKSVPRRRAAPQTRRETLNWAPAEPAIEIAIPAESMFPPGAVPEGVSFTAELSIGADGSAQQMRLRPRLIGFERRGTQP
jgi:anti-sigma factor RsiW